MSRHNFVLSLPGGSCWHRRLVGGFLLCGLVLPSAALAKPSVALNLNSQSEAGTSITYTFRTSHLPRHAKLAIQRQMGTAARFGTVATLPRVGAGSGTLPALSLGKYRMRIAVIEHGRVLAQHSQELYVFGTVVFSTLFNMETQTTTTASHSFSFVFQESFVTNPRSTAIVSAANNTCRSVRIEWVNSANGTLSLIQEALDPISASAGKSEISLVEGAVTPGQSWAISVVPAPPTSITTFWMNGAASCYSASV